MQRVLFINTSGATCTVTLADEKEIIGTRSNSEARDHAAFLSPAIEAMLREKGWTLSDVTAVCVMAGPGSYTGLRIGLATAKGICYALDIPLFLQNNLEVLAFAARTEHDGLPGLDYYVPLLKARAGEYFIAAYDESGNEIHTPQHAVGASVAELCEGLQHPTLLCIDPNIAVEIFGEHAPADVRIKLVNEPAVSAIVGHGLEMIQKSEAALLSSATPIYLKSPFTTSPANATNASH